MGNTSDKRTENSKSTNIELLKQGKSDLSIKMPHLHPILLAARDGNSKKLKELLEEKSDTCENNLAPDLRSYPEDYKYNFMDVMNKDEDGRTALHLAAAVTNEEMSLETIKILLNSKQVLVSETFENGKSSDGLKKLKKLVNCRDTNGEIAIIRAIDNKSPKVVWYLIDKNSDLLEKNVAGIEVLKLIHQKVPDALEKNYDASIQLSEDHKGLVINWGSVIGFRKVIEEKTSWADTEYLSYSLSQNNNTVDKILVHPLIKLFLDIKWKKIKLFFVASFIFHLLWLGLYAAAFVLLQESIHVSSNETEAEKTLDSVVGGAVEPFKGHSLWVVLLVVAVIVGIKEFYQLYLLGWAYFVLENKVQVSFIVLYVIQYFLLVSGHTETGGTVSVIGVFLMTVLVILLFGTIPCFGVQVGAIKKVIYTCAPHFPLLIIWFIGFGLMFWALFYKNEEDFSALGIPARIVAMGTGELEAKEMLEKALNGSIDLRDFVCVLCFVFFIVFVVTLHFNLLIGYAVSNIETLNKEAEALELYNRLSTIFTIESFLVTTAEVLRCPRMLTPLYVLPPRIFKKNNGAENMKARIPAKLMKELQDIAFKNLNEKNDV